MTNKEELQGTIACLETEIDDLAKWDAYNDDVFNEEVHILYETLKLIKMKAEDIK